MYTADIVSSVKVAHVGRTPIREYYLQITNAGMFNYSFCFGPYTHKDEVPISVNAVVYNIRNFIGYDVYTDDGLRINGVLIDEAALVSAGARRP